jgi:hypothetical protein
MLKNTAGDKSGGCIPQTGHPRGGTLQNMSDSIYLTACVISNIQDIRNPLIDYGHKKSRYRRPGGFKPNNTLVNRVGFEPTTHGLKGRCSTS